MACDIRASSLSSADFPQRCPCRFGAISSGCSEVNLDQRGVTQRDVEDIVPVLLALPHLQSLKLSKNCLGDAPMTALAPVLQAHSALQLMDLSANDIGDSGAVAIARALAGSSSITSLDLSNNFIGDIGAAAIESCLSSNHSLVQLELLGNPISVTAASGIGQALRVNRTIARSYASDTLGGTAVLLRAVQEREEIIGLTGAVMTQQKEQLVLANEEIAVLHERLRAQQKATQAMGDDYDRQLKQAVADAERERQRARELQGRLGEKQCGCCTM